jgi:hypothetical protein
MQLLLFSSPTPDAAWASCTGTSLIHQGRQIAATAWTYFGMRAAVHALPASIVEVAGLPPPAVPMV